MKTKNIKLIDENGIRVDGRKPNELRPTRIEVGILKNADGSAMIYQGKNKILAAVYGPRELHPKHLALSDRSLIRVTYRMSTFSVPERKSPAPSRREIEISKLLSEALDAAAFTKKFPRSVIDIFVQVLQADGGTRCASITAAAAALADAGIPMKDLVVGCSAGLVNGIVVKDPCDEEDKEGDGDLPLAYMPNLNQIVLLQLDGQFTYDQFVEAVNFAIEGCKEIHEIQLTALKKRYLEIKEKAENHKHLENNTKNNEDMAIEEKGEGVSTENDKEDVVEKPKTNLSPEEEAQLLELDEKLLEE